MKKRLAIIGNGMAAGKLLDDLAARNALAAFDIAVFGEEPHGCYNRILLGRVLNGEDPDAITLKPRDWYVRQGVTFHAGVKVDSLDTVARKVATTGGESHPYDMAVFATGSAPFVPKVEGLQAEDGSPRQGVFVYRTVNDCLSIRERSRPGSSAVVVGGGLLGLEAAKALCDLGLHVTVVHLVDTLMETQLDRFGADMLRRSIEKMGVFVRTGTTAAEIIGNGHVEAVKLTTGDLQPADIVVFACGIRPRVDAARASGVPVNRGILVNDMLMTQVPGVYAVGECAEHAGKVYGLVQPIWEQCSVLADVLTGANPRARYGGSKTYARLKVAGVEVASLGIIEPQYDTDEVIQVFEDRRGVYQKLIVRDGKLVGAMLVGSTDAAPGLAQIFDRSEVLPPNRLDVLATTSGMTPFAAGDAEICNCHRVTQSTLIEAIRGGRTTLPSLSEATRAGTGCGSCRGQLAGLILKHVGSHAATATG